MRFDGQEFNRKYRNPKQMKMTKTCLTTAKIQNTKRDYFGLRKRPRNDIITMYDILNTRDET